MKMSIGKRKFELTKPFVIARETISVVETIHVELEKDGVKGQGEATPQLIFDQTVESCSAQLEMVRHQVEVGVGRAAVQSLLPAGSARSALDCAIWDLEAKSTGKSVYEIAGLPSADKPLACDMSIGLGTLEEMQAAAYSFRSFDTIKVKLDAELVMERVAAVRNGAPESQIQVDVNEGWSLAELKSYAPQLADMGVTMIEQPIPRGRDWGLVDYDCPIDLGADESCFDRNDLPFLAGRYQWVNIKLDKAGGLTEALALAREAKTTGFRLMMGCAVSSSLAIAPGFVVGSLCELRDLDGSTMLAADCSPALVIGDGVIHPYDRALWG